MSSFAPQTGRDKPRVAIVSRLDQPGGVQSVALSLIKGLNRHGIVPDIVWDTPPNPRMLAEKSAQANHLPVRFPASSWLLDRAPITARYMLRMANVFTDQQLPQPYDFYYIFYNGFLVTGGAPHVRYLSGPPLLPQLDLASPGLRGLPYRSIRWLYRAALRHRFPVYEYHAGSRYVINSHFTADLFAEAHGVHLPVVHPPIDLSGRSFSAEDIAWRDTVTFFSRFIDYKRPEMVLELASRYPQTRFALMGGVKPQQRAYFEALREQARSNDLKLVEFFDNPSDDQVRRELARTRFYVFPAINEHFGMATVEAIGSGAVPFVHDSGGQREVVLDPRLRFTDSRFLDQFDALFHLPDAELNLIRARLREHIQQFTEEAFIEKMISFLNLRSESESTYEPQTAAL